MRRRYLQSILFLTFGLVYMSVGIAQTADPLEELKVCAKIADRNARLACFDDLGERVPGAESAVEDLAPATVAKPATAAQPEAVAETEKPSLPDDQDSSDSDRPDDVRSAGVITSCTESRDGRWFYYFDNGQVWKQVRYDKLRYKECNFNATVVKGIFGYKLLIDGEEKGIPVSRAR